jgi:phage/plasmid-associated DNA primase
LQQNASIENGEPDVARRILTFLSAQKLENIEKLAQPKLAISLTDFDTNPMQLCVGNGVIDLKTGKLMPPMPSMHHSKMAGVEYEAGATCPRFMQFLADIFPDDEELVGLRAEGGWLSADRKHEGAMPLHASGRRCQWQVNIGQSADLTFLATMLPIQLPAH